MNDNTGQYVQEAEEENVQGEQQVFSPRPNVPIWEKKLPTKIYMKPIPDPTIPQALPENGALKLKRLAQLADGWKRISKQRGLKPFDDYDKDGVPNILDCDPRNKFLQGPEQSINEKADDNLVSVERERRGLEKIDKEQPTAEQNAAARRARIAEFLRSRQQRKARAQAAVQFANIGQGIPLSGFNAVNRKMSKPFMAAVLRPQTKQITRESVFSVAASRPTGQGLQAVLNSMSPKKDIGKLKRLFSMKINRRSF